MRIEPLLSIPSIAPLKPLRRRLLHFAVVGVVALSIGMIVWQIMRHSAHANAKVLPMHGSVAAITLLCAVALAALEANRRVFAIICVAPVVIAISATIAAWVFGWSPPLGYTLLGESGNSPSWFPSRHAIEAAILIALMSLAVLATSFDRLLPITAPFAWATGLLLVIAPPIRFALIAQFAYQEIRIAPYEEAFTSILLMAFGAALLQSRRVYASASDEQEPTSTSVDDRFARIRALFVVVAIAATVVLWYAVRSTELRQLTSDVDSALEESARALSISRGDNITSADRLWQHWAAMRWQVSDDLFLRDASIYLNQQPAVAMVAMLDTNGRILRAARRNKPFGSPQSSNDPIAFLGQDTTLEPLADDAERAAALRAAIAGHTRVRQTAFIGENGAVFRRVVSGATAPSGELLGGFWLMYRPEISIERTLQDIAPDFHIRIKLDNRDVYERLPHGGVYANEDRFRRTSTRDFDGSVYVFDVAPNERIVRRALGWTPLLVLLFAWASLVLLMFALYNERRAHTLFRDRERILNQSLDLICTLRNDGVFVTANDAAQRILGVKPEELVGRSLVEFAQSEQRERMRTLWLTPAPETQTEPMQFRRADGRAIYLQAVSRWSPQEQLFYCAIRDVTAEHELHIQRRHAETTLGIGVAQAGCAVYEYQAAGRVVSEGGLQWTGSIAALTGYEADELAAGGFEGWMQLVHPDDAPHVRQILERCLETLQPHTVDYRLRRKDGTYVPVLDRGRHLTDADGAPRMIGALIDLTTIRQQETALRRSEERYRIIASQVGAVIIERETASGRIRVFGPVEQIFGYTKEQLESRPLTRDDTMIHPEDRAHYFAAVEAAEQNLASYYVEHRRRHRGGHYIYIASRGVVLPGADGRAEREVIAITDISERKLAEARLLESEERFRAAAEQARQIVYEYALDQQMHITELRFAGATEAVLGYAQADLREIQSQDRFALVHPDDVEAVRASGSGDLETTHQYNVEHRVRHRDGHYVYVENRGAVKRNSEGQVVGIVGMLLDITARRSADVERQQYTAQLRALADIAHKVGTLLSLHELLKYLATSMRELLRTNAAAALVSDPKLAPDEVVAVSYADHYGTQRGAAAPLGSRELHAQVRATNTPRRYTASEMKNDALLAGLTQNDDLRHPLNGWLGAPLIARDGANLGLLELSDKIDGEFTDGDLQVLNQLAGLASVAIENIRLYATLEERVAARTHELEISNRELEAFSYSVSHDLRAPLRAIAGFSNILETEYGSKLDAGAQRYLQRINAGVERMANLIDDLLSLARVSRAELKREPVDLTSLSKSILKRQTERIIDRTIETIVDTKMKTVADPRLVEVALENLIENALKFTGRRDNTRVHVGQRRIDGRLVFYVADNGVGFDPKYASNLFGVFQRLHSASDFPGTGVGLATVQRIVQRHHGRIWAEADIDRGATFYFTLSSEA